MHEYAIALISIAILVYSLAARWLSRSAVTGPMVFTALGLLFGPEALDAVNFDLDTQLIQIVLSVTLGLVLFTDATRIDLAALVRFQAIPGRLLLIGMPLTIVAGALAAGALFGEFDIWVAALVGAVLAPTDGAIGQAAVTNQRVPVRVRQSLSIESGMNDGVVLPIVTILLALALSDQGTVSGSFVVETVLRNIGIGLLTGVVVGAGVGWLIAEFVRRDWIHGTWLSIGVLTTPGLAFGLAEPLDGSGFVASFVAGLAFGRRNRDHLDRLTDLTDDIAQLFVWGTFMIFGGALLGDLLGTLAPSIVVYVVLSLTVVRMIPTACALLGTGFRWPTVLFMGWFGPRGLASILFVVVIVEDSPRLEGVERLTEIVGWTVAVSIILHGISAWPGSNRYADWVESTEDERDDVVEAGPAPEQTTKRYFDQSGQETE